MIWLLPLLLLNDVPNLRQYPATVTDLVDALGGDDKKMRWYAARELNRMAKYNTKLRKKSSPDSIEELEARMEWSLLNELAAPECVNKLKRKEVVSECASIVRHLEYKAALPELKKAESMENRYCTKRALKKAIRVLESK